MKERIREVFSKLGMLTAYRDLEKLARDPFAEQEAREYYPNNNQQEAPPARQKLQELPDDTEYLKRKDLESRGLVGRQVKKYQDFEDSVKQKGLDMQEAKFRAQRANPSGFGAEGAVEYFYNQIQQERQDAAAKRSQELKQGTPSTYEGVEVPESIRRQANPDVVKQYVDTRHRSEEADTKLTAAQNYLNRAGFLSKYETSYNPHKNYFQNLVSDENIKNTSFGIVPDAAGHAFLAADRFAEENPSLDSTIKEVNDWGPTAAKAFGQVLQLNPETYGPGKAIQTAGDSWDSAIKAYRAGKHLNDASRAHNEYAGMSGAGRAIAGIGNAALPYVSKSVGDKYVKPKVEGAVAKELVPKLMTRFGNTGAQVGGITTKAVGNKLVSGSTVKPALSTAVSGTASAVNPNTESTNP